MAMLVWLFACVYQAHAAAEKFLDSGADKLVSDAQNQKVELGKFFDEVVEQGSAMKQELAAEKEKNAELAAAAKKAATELKHEKTAFEDELQKVESKLDKKVKMLELKNDGLKSELTRAKLAVNLHEKAEDVLRKRLSEIGSVFNKQEAAVKDIIKTSTEVDTKLKAQDEKETKTSQPEAVPVAAEKTTDDVAAEAEKTADEAEASVAKLTDDASEKSADTSADDAVAAKSTTVSLAHGSHAAATTATPAKADDLDLPKADDSKVEPTAETSPAPPKDASEMDSISKEVDDLDKEVSTDSSASMLNKAGNELDNLLKS
jgi:hypothetical protein